MKKSAEAARPENSPPRARGRPRQFDRDKALSVATLLFWSKGYERTSIADLTQAMGIEAPSLYAAFGSKRELFAEALQHYGDTFEHHVWGRFREAATAREAVEAYLLDSAAALTGTVLDVPRGCMATLAHAESDVQTEVGDLVRSLRAAAYGRLKDRISAAVVTGELSDPVNVSGLARFVQSVQSGMSILARDGVDRSQLESVARTAVLGWDGILRSGEGGR